MVVPTNEQGWCFCGRLDVQLLAPSPGDHGWEVFSLVYHLQSPLSTIFTAEAMESYLRLFNFLWR